MRWHLIDGNPSGHNTYADDPDVIPPCPCNPKVRRDDDEVYIEHQPL